MESQPLAASPSLKIAVGRPAAERHGFHARTRQEHSDDRHETPVRDECPRVANGIYRLNTPIVIDGAGGLSFNQYLIADDEPLLFHTGPRKLFALVREAVASVVPIETLRYIAFSHVEADECGSLNDWLAAAP
jgi:hypothetical protein